MEYLKKITGNDLKYDDSIRICSSKLSDKIKAQYPDAIPIVIIPPMGTDFVNTKFMIRDDINNVQFQTIINSFFEKNKLDHRMSYNFLIDDKIISPSSYIVDLHRKHQYNGILFIYLSPENTFG